MLISNPSFVLDPSVYGQRSRQSYQAVPTLSDPAGRCNQFAVPSYDDRNVKGLCDQRNTSGKLKGNRYTFRGDNSIFFFTPF